MKVGQGCGAEVFEPHQVAALGGVEVVGDLGQWGVAREDEDDAFEAKEAGFVECAGVVAHEGFEFVFGYFECFAVVFHVFFAPEVA